MDVRVGLIVLLVLAGNWVCDARNLATSVHSGEKNNAVNADLCTMCEEYATVTLNYLNDNQTQSDVMKFLHKICSELYSLEDPCTVLVDHYAPLFFLEVLSVKPKELCNEVGLCSKAGMTSLSKKQDKCDLCHNAVNEVLIKLKDPDTQLGIIEVLLKACNVVEDYAHKCKSLVFQYGPLILIDAEKFLEDVDICTTFHACSQEKANTKDVLPAEGQIKME